MALLLFQAGDVATASSVVLSFGDNGSGRTGLDTNDGATLIATPTDTTHLTETTIIGVATGNAHSLLLSDDGSAFGFGFNGRGQVGLGTTTDALIATPIDVSNLTDKTITQVAGGELHSLLVADGSIYSFGFNGAGRTGLGFDDNGNTLVATPIDTTNLANETVTQVEAGFRHSLLLTDDNVVYSFGANVAGATGLGTTLNNTFVATPIDTTNLEGKAITQVAAGERFSLVLDDNGAVYSFGASDQGQAGLGPVLGADVAMPLDTTNLDGKTITQVAAGRFHSLILAGDGTVFSFGSNAEGQTGIGADIGATTIATPIDTTNLAGKTITKVAAGDRLSLLLADDGTVFSFGSNRFGQTGLGTNTGWTAIATPIDTTHLAGLRVTDIAAGHGHSLLLAIPVPEPAGVTLALLAGVALLIARVRRAWPGGHVVAVLATCLLTSTVARADHKPGHGSGGGRPTGDAGGKLQLVELHPNGSAYAINDGGIVVGGVDRVAGTWNAKDETPTFSPLPGDARGAQAINGAGEVVGFSWVGSQAQPVYWSSLSAEPVDLPLPSGFTRGWANGISGNGVIVGEVDDGQEFSAAVWRVSEGSIFGPIILGLGGANDVASLTSSADRIVGRTADPNFGHVATAWDLNLHSDGSFDVAGLTNLAPGHSAEAFAITDSGDATGIIKWGGGIENTAFVLRGGAVQLLSSGRNQYSVGFDLDDTDVVGATALQWYSNSRNATQWNSRNKPHDLMREFFNDSWSSTSAQGINDNGSVVGYGSGGAWLLRRPLATGLTGTAIPEQSAIALAAIGMLGLAARIRRPRRSTSC